MSTETFSNWTKARAKMSNKSVLSVRQRVVNYYRSLYDTTFGRNMFLVFFGTLTEPPMTFAKVSTYLLATVVLSTGVYAGIAPSSFFRTSTAVKETVQTAIKTSIETFIPSASRSTQKEDLREGVNEVFCRGERRDPQDCSLGSGMSTTGNTNEVVDVREDDDEVFCDGERRDAEDCAKRAVKRISDLNDDTLEIVIGRSDDDSGDDEGNDVREDDDEVFCDGERRDAEDCAKRAVKRISDLDDDTLEIVIGRSDDDSGDDEGNDVREDNDEIFCDGERRDAEDCAKRIAKDTDEDKVDNEDDDE